MGSSYFGEPNIGSNERASGSSSSSSSRKGKKNNNNQDKPKQPQRGLGVAQLEKIRLHSEMATAYHPPPLHAPYPSNFNNEDLRVQTPYSSLPSSSSPSPSFTFSSSSTSHSSSYGFQPNIVMGLPEYERTNIRYGENHPTRWEHANAILEPSELNITRPLLNLYDSQPIDIKKHRSGSMGSSSQNSESSNTQEPDLELRLSL